MLRALWDYRRFVGNMVGRELRSRWSGSLLGWGWSLLTPLTTILIYLVVFSAVMQGKMPGRQQDPLAYGIFLCTGILVWGYFAEVVVRCQESFLDFSNLLKKMSFPRITLPAIVLGTATVSFVLVALLFLALLAVLGRLPGAALWAFLPLLVLQQAIAIGLGIFAGTLNVFFRDVGQLLAVLLHLWFWGTPIVYDLDILPEATRPLIAANPLTAVYRGYQGIVLENRWPQWGELGPAALTAAVVLVLGLFTFRKLSWEMVDEL